MCCKPLARYSFRHFRKSCRRLANQELRLQLRIFSPTFPLICGLPRLFPRVGLYKEGNDDFFLSLFFTVRFMLLFCPCCIMNPASRFSLPPPPPPTPPPSLSCIFIKDLDCHGTHPCPSYLLQVGNHFHTFTRHYSPLFSVWTERRGI